MPLSEGQSMDLGSEESFCMDVDADSDDGASSEDSYVSVDAAPELARVRLSPVPSARLGAAARDWARA